MVWEAFDIVTRHGLSRRSHVDRPFRPLNQDFRFGPGPGTA